MKAFLILSIFLTICQGSSLVHNLEQLQKGLETANVMLEKGSKIAESIGEVASIFKKTSNPTSGGNGKKRKKEKDNEEDDEERKRKRKKKRDEEEEQEEEEKKKAKAAAIPTTQSVVPQQQPVSLSHQVIQQQPVQYAPYANSPPFGLQDPTRDPLQPINPIMEFKEGVIKAAGDVAVGQKPMTAEIVPGGILITQETFEPRNSLGPTPDDLAMTALKQRILLLEHSLEREKTESKLLIQRLNGIDGLTEDQRYNELRRLRVQQEGIKSDVGQMKSFFNSKNDS